MSVGIFSCSLHDRHITHHFFVDIFLNCGGSHFYMYEACLGLPYCVTEASPFTTFLITGHKALVYAVLVSPIIFIFQIRDISYPGFS